MENKKEKQLKNKFPNFWRWTFKKWYFWLIVLFFANLSIEKAFSFWSFWLVYMSYLLGCFLGSYLIYSWKFNKMQRLKIFIKKNVAINSKGVKLIIYLITL